MRIYMIRHGVTDWNEQQRLQGREDIPLNEAGREQAHELGRVLSAAGVHFDRIITSPLVRASETAQILSEYTGGAPVTPEEGLTEIDFGTCSGMRYEEYQRFLQDGCVQEKEDRDQADKRVLAAVKNAVEGDPDETIALVFHGAVMAVLLSRLAGREVGGRGFHLKNGCVNILSAGPGILSCEAFNLSPQELSSWLEGERRPEWQLPSPESGKLYYRIPYVKEFDALIRYCYPRGDGHYDIVLDRTAFYPEGGGQPADTGTLGDVRVLHVTETGGQILHETDRPLTPQDTVHGVIDWEERFARMQMHTGEHILSGLVLSHYGYDNVGFHMAEDEVTIDWNGYLSPEQLEELERETNELIWQDIPVETLWPSDEERLAMSYRSKKELTGAVRILKIGEADICACCGTHVAKTGEVGLIKVTGSIHYKKGVRITLKAGRKAAEDYGRMLSTVQELGHLFSVPAEGVAAAAAKAKEELDTVSWKMGKLRLHMLEEKAGAMEPGEDILVLFEEDLTPDELRHYATAIVEQKKAAVVLACSAREGGGYSYAAVSSSADLKAAARPLNEALHGRGGGTPQMIRGSFEAEEGEIREVFLKLVSG